ncbi:hypothetical protein GQ54DRAFT_142517 [Martensiomyces pterosporus]|nr:hypothetical protein GQ54DRAFT_142517 [Martensiomyces pterosporus]
MVQICPVAPRTTHICCIGAGYVGGPTSSVMASRCPDIQFTVVDTDRHRIDAWNSGSLPVYEPGLDAIVKAQRGRNLHFSTDVDGAIRQADVIFIAVNTPPAEQNSGPADLRNIEQCARRIAEVAQSTKIVVEKSTVPCGTGDLISNTLAQFAQPGVEFHVLSNPEFLSEGTAIADLSMPDRVIIGGVEGSDEAQLALKSIYARWVPDDRIVTMGMWSAELVKLASNAMLAQRVSSINAISVLCEHVDADIADVARGCGMDSRIGSRFLRASVGFGGSCFHKDVSSLVWLSDSLGLPEVAEYWRQVLRLNDFQTSRFAATIAQTVQGGLHGKRVACLGFAYKSDTGDARNTPAGNVCRDLLQSGAHLSIYDPKVPEHHIVEKMGSYASESAGSWDDRIRICSDVYAAVGQAQAVVVLTAWSEFAHIDWARVLARMKRPAYVFDGQVMLDHEALRRLGFCVYSIGKTHVTNQ